MNLAKDIIYILTGIAILLVGMRLMSGGLKKSIGKGVKTFFKKTQNNPALSMGIGTVVTAGIQSSDATNAMVIGFINIGVMSVSQGLWMMLGAYIGTTVTGVIASFSSLSISIYLLLFSFVGIIMTFFKNEKVKNIGEILLGLGLLFFSLGLMKDAFKNPDITAFCSTLFTNFDSPIILFLIGVLITALIQSSSAITSIIIAMVGSGALPLSLGLYLVLGSTLGTVVTTLLSAIGGNNNGKKAALIAFILRLLSSLTMLIILWIFIQPITSFMQLFAVNNSNELPIAMFAVFYNVIFMPLLIPLVKPFVSLFDRLFKKEESSAYSGVKKYIDDKLVNTPEIALMQTKKEIINMYQKAYINYQYGLKAIMEKDIAHDKLIIQNEKELDYLNNEITQFLIKLSPKVSLENEKIVGSLFHVVNDIERIGDHAYNFYEMRKDMDEKDLTFSSEALNEISILNDHIKNMFILAEDIFTNNAKNKLEELHNLEAKIDELKVTYSSNHYERIVNKQCKHTLTPYIYSMLTELERIADHLTNVGYSIKNPTGDE